MEKFRVFKAGKNETYIWFHQKNEVIFSLCPIFHFLKDIGYGRDKCFLIFPEKSL